MAERTIEGIEKFLYYLERDRYLQLLMAILITWGVFQLVSSLGGQWLAQLFISIIGLFMIVYILQSS